MFEKFFNNKEGDPRMEESAVLNKTKEAGKKSSLVDAIGKELGGEEIFPTEKEIEQDRKQLEFSKRTSEILKERGWNKKESSN